MATAPQTPTRVSPDDMHPVGSHDDQFWVKGQDHVMTLPDTIVQDTQSPSDIACAKCESGLCVFTMRGNPVILEAFANAFEQQVIPKWNIKTPADLRNGVELIRTVINSIITQYVHLPPITEIKISDNNKDQNAVDAYINLNEYAKLSDLPQDDGQIRPKTMAFYVPNKHEMALSLQSLVKLPPYLIYFMPVMNTLYHECRHAEQRYWQANFMQQHGFNNVARQISTVVFDAAASASEKITKTHPYYRCVLRWYASTHGVPDVNKWKEQNPKAEEIVQSSPIKLNIEQKSWNQNAWIYEEKDPRNGKPLIESMDINAYNQQATYNGMAAEGMGKYLLLPEEDDGKATGDVLTKFIMERIQKQQEAQLQDANTKPAKSKENTRAKRK